MEDKQGFELWKEYYGDLLRETEQAYTQGATQQEAKTEWDIVCSPSMPISSILGLPQSPTVPAAKGKGWNNSLVLPVDRPERLPNEATDTGSPYPAPHACPKTRIADQIGLSSIHLRM
jgi:hypothetical protein